MYDGIEKFRNIKYTRLSAEYVTCLLFYEEMARYMIYDNIFNNNKQSCFIYHKF